MDEITDLVKEEKPNKLTYEKNTNKVGLKQIAADVFVLLSMGGVASSYGIATYGFYNTSLNYLNDDSFFKGSIFVGAALLFGGISAISGLATLGGIKATYDDSSKYLKQNLITSNIKEQAAGQLSCLEDTLTEGALSEPKQGQLSEYKNDQRNIKETY